MILYTRFDPAWPPPPLRCNEPDSFALRTMTGRIPGVARQILTDHAASYPDLIKRRVQALHDDLVENRPLTPLQTTAPDGPDWARAWQPYAGQAWLETPWYFAESFFYRKLIEATGYFGSEGWAGNDPYLPAKVAELQGEAAWAVLASALARSEANNLDSLQTLLHFCLWGNRVDLSYAQVWQAQGRQISLDRESANLLADDSAAVLAHLDRGQTAPTRPRLAFICDNAGTELLTDLALTDFLLRFDWAEQITLHVKAYPTYVSDTTVADIDLTLQHLASRPQPAGLALAERLTTFRRQERLVIRPDFFWTSCHFFWEIAGSLREELTGNQLVFVKGDANYRRLLGDSRWPTSVPMSQAVPYFPTSFVALRTLKSDPIVGLPSGLADRLSGNPG